MSNRDSLWMHMDMRELEGRQSSAQMPHYSVPGDARIGGVGRRIAAVPSLGFL